MDNQLILVEKSSSPITDPSLTDSVLPGGLLSSTLKCGGQVSPLVSIRVKPVSSSQMRFPRIF